MCYEPLKCPNCEMPEPVRTETKGVYRWYLCPACRFTFRTLEQVEAAVEGQAFQAALWQLVTEANGSRGRARALREAHEEKNDDQ